MLVDATRRFALILALASPLVAGPTRAAGLDEPPSRMESAVADLEDGEYEAAIAKLSEQHAENPSDADVLNLLGYANRKLGNLDEALAYYQQALAIEPDHKGANEYLGELYLQRGEVEKAEARLAVLDGACFFTCREYRDLEEAIARYKKAHGLE